jgi:surface polysaccharide O-acyltransferase-like enzyme
MSAPTAAPGPTAAKPRTATRSAAAGVQAAGPSGGVAPVPLWKRIAPMRGAAMLLVVANHASQSATNAFVATHERLSPHDEPYAFVTVNVIRGLTPACLIAFVFASGFMAFRFMRSPAQALPAAAQMLRRYLSWSALVLIFVALRRGAPDWSEMARELAVGRAMPAYWFLLILIPLYASAPFFARLVMQRPHTALGLAALLQVASCAKFYAFDLSLLGPLPVWDVMLVRPLRFVPAFLAGMLISRDADAVARWLSQWRRALLIALPLSAVVCLAEAYALDRAADFYWKHMDRVLTTERVGLIAFGCLCVAMALTRRLGRPRVQSWLAVVGNASLGIMLLMDFFIAGGSKVWWQLARFSSDEGARAVAQHALPPAFADASLWLMPALFMLGLWGPLKLMKIGHRVLGRNARHLW